MLAPKSEPHGCRMNRSCGVLCSLFRALPGPFLECANTQAVSAEGVYYVFIGCCQSYCHQSRPALMLPQKRDHNHQSWEDLSPLLLGTNVVPHFSPDPRMAANQQRPASPSPARQATASPAWATGRATTATPRCLPATPCSLSPLRPPTLPPGNAWHCSVRACPGGWLLKRSFGGLGGGAVLVVVVVVGMGRLFQSVEVVLHVHT